MPIYNYTAKSLEGETKSGTSASKDEKELSQDLRREGLFLVKAVSDEEIKEKRSFLSFFISKARISSTEKILMTRNLWIMTATGMSMVKIFDVLAIQAKNKKFKNVLLDIREKINKGDALSTALAHHPSIFSALFLSMVKIGEESGTLESVFETLSLQIEKEHEIKSKVQGAMIYPSVILLTMLGVGIVIMTFVLPKLDVFFSGLGANLPWYTRIIINVGKFSQAQWPFIIIAPFVLGFILWKVLKTKKGKWTLDTFMLKVPVVSTLVKESNCAFLIRSLSSMITSGVPILRSLEISSDVVENSYFKKAVNYATEKVKKGESLSSALRVHQNIFPFGTVEMIEVGEKTGKTSEILKRLAEFYEQEVVNASEKLSSAIEPVLIVIMGVAVGLFAFAIIEPMYSVLGSIG